GVGALLLLVEADVGLAALHVGGRLGVLDARVGARVGLLLLLVLRSVGDALDVGVELRLLVLGLLHEHALLGAGAGERLGLLGLGPRLADVGRGRGLVLVERRLLDERLLARRDLARLDLPVRV